MRHILLVLSIFTFGCANSMEIVEANVTKVTAKGESGKYFFSVTLESREKGCEQYADWWEVVSQKGELIYRRILVHSHPDTQPFTRSGGYVRVDRDELVYVRAHMNREGYVGSVMRGSVSSGFKITLDTPKFSEDIEVKAPLPKGCLY